MKIELYTNDGQLGILDTSFVIVTTIETLQSEKGKHYLDFWLYWADEFDTIRIPVWILTKDSSLKTFQHKAIHLASLHFAYCPSSTFRKLDAYQTKNVFGKNYYILSPAIYLFYQDKIIYKRLRTNHKFIGEAYLAALDIRYKNFVSNFRKKLTSKKEFDSM